MFKKALTSCFIFALSMLLTACMSLGNLSYKQARMLKSEGFVLTEDGWTLALPERLLFSFDDYLIQEQQKSKIITLSDQLHKYKLEKVKFTGHTDNIGLASYNQQLSEKRAQSVANVFLEHGFQPKNVQIIGRGAEQPLVSNDSEEHRAENRRVNITIIP
ncbi:OmpA family protein [Acinetobacter sp.]|uniref:OmpA family protein n=1 Tax=Acinetobacter sp. TaxID=472 RepID=UPI0035B1E72E